MTTVYSVGEIQEIYPPWRDLTIPTYRYQTITLPVEPGRKESVPVVALLMLIRKWLADGSRNREQIRELLDAMIEEMKKV